MGERTPKNRQSGLGAAGPASLTLPDAAIEAKESEEKGRENSGGSGDFAGLCGFFLKRRTNRRLLSRLQRRASQGASATPQAAFGILNSMTAAPLLDREEHIEQVYFFRVFRERLAHDFAAQEILERLDQEILSTTRLPLAIQFLAAELKHTGILASGFERLPHYFTAFQTFVIGQAEKEGLRFSMPMALLVLEREAQYRADKPTPPGLFVYQFEAISRNRLGYDEGLAAMAGDSMYNGEWRDYLAMVRRQVGAVDFGDLIFVRSELYVQEEKRRDPDYVPPVPPLFGEKEGKIARANRGRDPLYLFAALQRQLGYPEVPRPRERDDVETKLQVMGDKLKVLEARLRLVEGEVKGNVDLSQFKPEMFRDAPADE